MYKTDETTRQILEWFEVNRHLAWRHNQVRVPGRGFPKRNKGIGDIVAVLRPGGRHIEVEVKTGGDKIRPDQYLRAMEVQRVGGYYLVVKDFQDFLGQMKTIVKSA